MSKSVELVAIAAWIIAGVWFFLLAAAGNQAVNEARSSGDLSIPLRVSQHRGMPLQPRPT
jgi:hypothetical protein